MGTKHIVDREVYHTSNERQGFKKWSEIRRKYLNEHMDAGKNFIQKICEELITYVQDPQNTTFNKFFLEQDFDREHFLKWVEKHPELKACYALCHAYLYENRRKPIKWELSTLQFDMHQYSPEWQQAQSYHDERKRKRDEKNTELAVEAFKSLIAPYIKPGGNPHETDK